MRASIASISLFLTVALLLAPGSLAASGPSTGAYVGTVTEGDSVTYQYTTHGDDPCLAIYIPTTFIVTLAYAPPTDTLGLSIDGGSVVEGEDGTVVVSFVRNYCTEFTVTVTGVDVDALAAFSVSVRSAPVVADLGGVS